MVTSCYQNLSTGGRRACQNCKLKKRNQILLVMRMEVSLILLERRWSILDRTYLASPEPSIFGPYKLNLVDYEVQPALVALDSV